MGVLKSYPYLRLKYILFLDGHFRIEQGKPCQFKLASPISGDVWCGIVHTGTRFRTRVIDGTYKQKCPTPCPIKISTKHCATTYKRVIFQDENIEANGAIVSLLNEDTITFEFLLNSSDVPGGDLADAKLQELVILPVEPTFKTSTDVFITKKNLDLRQDPPLDIQVFAVLRPIDEKIRIIKEKQKKYSNKPKVRFTPPRKTLQRKFMDDLKKSDANVIATLEETLALDDYNLIELVHLGLSHKFPPAPK